MKEEIWPRGGVRGFLVLACWLCRLRRNDPEPPSFGVGVFACRKTRELTPLARSD